MNVFKEHFSTETSVDIAQTTRHSISEDGTLGSDTDHITIYNSLPSNHNTREPTHTRLLFEHKGLSSHTAVIHYDIPFVTFHTMSALAQ